MEWYKLPGPVDMPEIVPILDVPEDATGVRSLGEPPMVGVPAAIANAIADMLWLFGTSAMMTRSYSPKQYQPPTSLPPTASQAARPTASTRFCGFLSWAAQDSGV